MFQKKLLSAGQNSGFKIFILTFFIASFVYLYPIPYILYPSFANHLGVQQPCNPTVPGGHCRSGLTCQRTTIPQAGLPAGTYTCFSLPATPGPADVFGKIIPPQAIINLGFGALGITQFFNNLITLIYAIAAVVFIFMLLWGAFEWLTSGGDKEKVASAQRRLVNAFVGIVLFAVAFAILQVIGVFTGFTFFR